jgi:O-antigen/teichoic acid export membrane protein
MNEQLGDSQRSAVGKVAIVGSAMQIGGRLLRTFAGIGTIAILARFLTPSDFGSFALIYSLVMLSSVLADLGLRVALVQRSEVTDLECQSVFWTSAISGAILTAVLVIFSGPIATLFGNPGLAKYVVIVSPIFIIIGMRGVPLAILERRFKFKTIAGIDLAAAVTGSLVAIGMALAGSTVGALVAQQMTMIGVMAVLLFYFARWMPRFQFSRTALKPLASYGSFVTITGILQSTAPMINRPLIGNRLSTADLGYLTMSDQIVQSPVRIIAASIRRVTFPLMSSFQNDNARIVAAHRNTLHALSLGLAPCVLGIAALAEPVTALVLGPTWASIALVLALVAPRALTSSIGEMNSAVFASKGQARFQFLWAIFSLVLSVSVILLLIPHGIEAIVVGQLLVSLFVTLPLYTWFLARLLETSIGTLLLPIARPVLAALAMALVVFGFDQWLETLGMPMIVRAVAGAAVGVPIYLGLILLIDRDMALTLWAKLKAIRSKRAA